jgi:hypothetical protein
MDAESIRWKLVNEFIKTGYVSQLEDDDNSAERKKRLKIAAPEGSKTKFHLQITQYRLRK